MTIAKFIEELNDKFYPCNELVFVCGEDRDLKPTMEYEGDKAKIEIDYCPGEYSLRFPEFLELKPIGQEINN